MKVFILFVFIFSFVSSAQSSQKVILNNLFDQLQIINNSKSSALLEQKIWSIWNEHPSDFKLTEKLEFGTELMQYGDYDYALKVFSNILENDPKWSEAWNKRATVFYMVGEFNKSQDDIDKVLELEKRHFGALAGQGMVNIQLKNYDKAKRSYQKVLEIYPAMKSPKVMIEQIEELIKRQSI